MIEVAYKYLELGDTFVFDEQVYIKTSFNRGYYYREGKKVHRNFKKKTIVQTNTEFDIIPK